MKRIVLTVTTGPEMGRRLEVPPAGATLGRSARMADLRLADELLSRIHCRFFMEGDQAMVQDLGSSNGTSLNGEELGGEPRPLRAGDVVTVGETALRCTLEEAAGAAPSEPLVRGPLPQMAPEAMPPPPPEAPAPAEPVPVSPAPEVPEGGVVDLGLSDERPAAANPKRGVFVGLGIGLAAIGLLAIGSWLFLSTAPETETLPVSRPVPREAEKPLDFTYERLSIDARTLYRYRLSYLEGGELSLEIVDLGAEDRSFSKSQTLDASEKVALRRILLAGSPSYRDIGELAPMQSADGTLARRTLTLALGTELWSRTDENLGERDFAQLCENLEAFARASLGVVATQYSVEELRELAREELSNARRAWELRDNGDDYLFKAVDAYRQGLSYVETLNPKPDFTEALQDGLAEADGLLTERHQDLLFAVDQAEHTRRWDVAAENLQRILQLIPDRDDPRYQAAQNRLLSLENLKKGGR